MGVPQAHSDRVGPRGIEVNRKKNMACYTGRTSYFMSGNNKYCVSICRRQRPHPPDPHSHPHSHHPTCQRILPLNQPQINKHGRVQLYRNSTLG